jgi:hypothetical protein
MRYHFKINHLFAIILITVCLKINAQTPNSNSIGNGVIQNQANPIELSTGLPFIGVPLYSLPTVSDGLQINLSLSYHPASVAITNQNIGNCGRGWTMPTGGAIYGSNALEKADGHYPDGERTYFNYSFMGYSGSFYVTKYLNTMTALIQEDSESLLTVDVAYNAQTKIITGFTLHDHFGYKYIFNTVDTANFAFLTSTGGYSNEVDNYMYQLSIVKDNNDATLATFNYKNYGNTIKNNIIESIVSHHGKIEFETTLGNSAFYNSSWNFSKITVRDFKNNFIRQFDFTYDNEQLIQLDENNGLVATNLSHKFYYRNNLIFLQGTGVDEWGYLNSNALLCNDLTTVSPLLVTNSILQKIAYPSGGCTIYEFESNDYSYRETKNIDENLTVNGWVSDPNFFTTINYKNLHNLNAQTLVNTPVYSNTPKSFTITSTTAGDVYFKLSGTPYISTIDDGNGNYPIVNPNFTLRRNGTVVTHIPALSLCENDGLGMKLNLIAGNYTLTMNSLVANDGTALLTRYTPSTNVKKWHYGNGIRIKRIGYFDVDNVNQGYYELPNQTILPIKEVSYNYRLADDNSKSSGCIFNIDVLNGKPTIIYRNVTVSESNQTGKIVYTFYAPSDYFKIENFNNQIPNFTKPKNIKVYDHSNTLIQEKRFIYNGNVIGSANQNPKYLLQFDLKYSLLTEAKEINYVPAISETTTNYTYDVFRKIFSSRINVDQTDFVEKKYYYHTLNSPTSKNRRVVDKIETYRNQDLLFTSKINFSNVWPTVNEPGTSTGSVLPPYPNVSYLPSSNQSAKTTNPFITDQNFIIYDGYSKVWESQKDLGLKTVYIWGYNHTQIVAKIENCSYSTIPPQLIYDIVTASTSGTEAQLTAALNNLRSSSALAHTMITTYTYKPLIGVNTITDVKNEKTTFFYDTNNRLSKVTDASGNILQESEYYFKTQN